MKRLNSLMWLSGLLAGVMFGCTTTPERYDIAFIEFGPGASPSHFRFMSTTGALSGPVFLPNGMKVQWPSENSLSWSPDGLKLAFASEVGGNVDIYTMNANGTDLKRITLSPARDESPTWSPDGTRILFISNRDGINLWDIYVHDLTSGAETRLTTASGRYLGSVWSPDSRKIAYVQNREPIVGWEDYEIYILDLTSGATAQVGTLTGNQLAQSLQWAPSADVLLFRDTKHPPTHIYTMRTDGSGLQNLTQSAFPDAWWFEDPSWFSGGRILFVKLDTQFRISFYVMNQDGTGKTLLKAFATSSAQSPRYRFAAVDLPDLVVSSYHAALQTAAPQTPTYAVRFKIQNLGTARSNDTVVYVDAINPNPPPWVNEIGIQRHVLLPPLMPGEESTEFQLVFSVADIHAKQIRQFKITVDPKNTVNEAFETNNMVSWPWP